MPFWVHSSCTCIPRRSIPRRPRTGKTQTGWSVLKGGSHCPSGSPHYFLCSETYPIYWLNMTSKKNTLQFVRPAPFNLSLGDLNVGYQAPQRRNHRTGDHRLTPAEFRVLNLSLKGHANKEIARELHISPLTVKFHLANIFVKLGTHRKRDLQTSERFGPLLPQS